MLKPSVAGGYYRAGGVAGGVVSPTDIHQFQDVKAVRLDVKPVIESQELPARCLG